MKKALICAWLILAALVTGCGSREMPPVTSDATTPAEVTTTAPMQTQPASTESGVTLPTETAPAEPAPTETAVPTETTPTLPLPTEPISAPAQGVTLCGHDYQPGAYQAPTCEQAGFQSFVCCKCGEAQQQLSLPLGHSYTAATCTTAECCSRCGITRGAALGHRFDGGSCSRCGERDPAVRTITIQVKDSKNNPVDGVTVALYIGGNLDQYAGSQTSRSGKVSFTLQNHTGSYKLVLTQVPEGYKPQKDNYTYRSDSGSVVLDIVPVIRPDDHSKAAYRVGSVMGDFTVTDVGGQQYQLSRLLGEKRLVILNFWYYTCVPCKAEFPYFESVYQRYGDEIEILALNHFDSDSIIRQLQSEMGLSFPMARERLGMQQGFGIPSYPFSVFIGSDGRILYIQKDVGFETESQLDTLVRQMLGK